ncbi:MAG: hypothetical protein IKG14_05500 [Clostridia bacterium]|nr:hypothetical protein [Clostridia bacterium]
MKEKINLKKILVVIIIIAAIIIAIFSFLVNNKGNDTVKMNENRRFQEIGLKYLIENEFLDYKQLNILNKNGDEYQETNKYVFAISKTMEKNRSNIASTEDVKQMYSYYFGYNLDLDEESEIISNIQEKSKNKYAYDEENRNIIEEQEKIDNIENNNGETELDDNEENVDNYFYEITEISYKEDICEIKLNIRVYDDIKISEYLINEQYDDEFEREKNYYLYNKIYSDDTIDYSTKNQIISKIITDENKENLTKKIREAVLTIKIDKDRYIIEDYIEDQEVS